MSHLPAFISDLALVLATAGISILICRALKQPVVLGYIIAGFLVGPHFPLIPDVTDFKSIKVWADIGVIFLLFTIGLEFSYKKLAAVGKSALVAVLIKTLFMVGLGYFVGRIFDWSATTSMFLGAILAISSTTIVVRTFEEMGIKREPWVGFVYASLIAEDIVAIILLVFLSTLTVTHTFSGMQLVGILGQLFFFLVLCFVLGLYFFPMVMKKTQMLLNEETILVLALGSCLVMVCIASYVGFSPALGAFVIGSIFAETPLSQDIEKVTMPIKHLFAAIFFVSIGILFDPTVFQDHYYYVIIVALVTVIGKFVGTLLGSIVAGQNLKTSIQSGMSLSQIGEFSFIIAGLGLTLKATNSVLYPLAVATCVITSFLTPYLIRLSEPVYHIVVRQLPPKFLNSLDNYALAVQEQKRSSNFILLWELYGMKIVLNSTIVVSIALLYGRVLLPFLQNNFNISLLVESILLCLTLFTTMPFFWPILFGRPHKSSLYMETSFEKAQRLHIGITICRFLIGVLLLSFTIGQFSYIAAASSLLILGVLILFGPLIKKSETLYHRLEKGFMDNLNNDK